MRGWEGGEREDRWRGKEVSGKYNIVSSRSVTLNMNPLLQK